LLDFWSEYYSRTGSVRAVTRTKFILDIKKGTLERQGRGWRPPWITDSVHHHRLCGDTGPAWFRS
jgi:hypothetical protein